MQMKFEITAKRIKSALTMVNMSAKELSEQSGVKEASISQYVNGYHKPSNLSAGKMGKVLGVNPLWLMGFDAPMLEVSILPPFPNIHPIGTRSYPVLGSVSCGYPVFMSEEKEVYIDSTIDVHADFVLIAKGDSMIGARIHDGDIVFIRKQEMVENGEIAVVAIDDEATLKRFYKYADLVVLRAENPAYKDMEFRPEDHKEIRIIGKAVAFQSDVR